MNKKELKSTILSGKEKLLRLSKTDAQDVLAEYGNTEKGFDEERVEELRDEFGANVITHQESETMLKRVVKSFFNPFTIILLILALISLFANVIFAPKLGEERDPATVVIVLIMVSVSGILRFVQETRSGHASERLKAMINTTTCVQRAEGKIEIPLADVVLGDVIHLAAGDIIPADVRILTSKDLFVSESSLTGESQPVEKVSAAQNFNHKNPLELTNLAFMGSNVVSGSATCVAVATGDHTHFGTVAQSLTTKRPPTSFEKGVNSVSWLLIRFMFVMVPVVFFANGLIKGVIGSGGTRSWVDALMFALSVAVGLTPEMLPMIVTAGLAKGAVRMSKKKTVVKNLNSIQNFGAIDVLCTDKTGTLTRDEIVLESYLDIHGNSDSRILRHAFLNSYFQTGMKNLMDVAILNHIKDGGMAELKDKYVKVDEIPFDFTRRRMSVVIKDKGGKTQLITKGAVEEMLSISSYAEYNGVVPLTDEIKQEIMKTVEKLNADGMRVLAVAQKTNPSVEGVFSVKDESDMVLLGYLAFLDPPKESAKAAIMALKEHGVDVKILTGDNLAVTKCIAGQVGIKNDRALIGAEIDELDDKQLSKAIEQTGIFAKLTPSQKTRIVRLMRENGHVVGFMGDGINDAAAIREADVGISVDNAVDIAKESADIILLEKDLMVLEQGIIEGRKTFANIVKYIKMTASSNFGNMFSVLAASVLLPFLPMMPLQIIMLNLIYDLSCVSIPWDNVDSQYIKYPRKWDASSIGKFMFWIGPTSSIFDITTFIIMFFVICPDQAGKYSSLAAGSAEQEKFIALFQAGWFVESLWTQTLVIHMIRTQKLPFVQSRASLAVTGFTSLAIAIGTILPFTPLGETLGMTSLPLPFFALLAATIVAYMLLITLFKRIFVKKYGSLL